MEAVLSPGMPFMFATGPQLMVVRILVQSHFHLQMLWRYSRSRQLMENHLAFVKVELGSVKKK